LAAGVAACTPRDVPTPQQTTETELVELVPVTVEHVLPTSTPAPTNTLEPTQTTIPTQTASPITASPMPPTSTATPTPSFTLPANIKDTPITNVILSNKGQLAYIRDEILYAEIEPQTREFEEVGRFALAAVWSPDGSQLAYSTESNPNAELDDPDQIYDLHLWSPTDYSDLPLSELIANYPDPAPRVDELYWTPNGTKILMRSPLNQTEWEENNYTYEGKYSTIDLNSKLMIGNQLASSNQRVIWLTDDVYILRFHCGSPCADISAYDYSGNPVWSPYWTTGGFVNFAPNGNFMINVGRIDTNQTDNIPAEPYLPTLDKIDLSTGDIEILWELPVREDVYFTPFILPSISPDEQHFSFNFGGGLVHLGSLYIVDQLGNELGQYENSYALGWDISNNLMLNKLMETGENQLQLASLDGSVKSVFTTEPGTEITGAPWTPSGGGAWSPDGQYFTFITKDSNHKSAQIYLWKTDAMEPQLIHSVSSNESFQAFQSLNWLPDSTGFYFTSSGGSSWRYEAIWYYDVESDDLKLVAPMND
jgi:hypothetical protein